jgi:hypothetical protein
MVSILLQHANDSSAQCRAGNSSISSHFFHHLRLTFCDTRPSCLDAHDTLQNTNTTILLTLHAFVFLPSIPYTMHANALICNPCSFLRILLFTIHVHRHHIRVASYQHRIQTWILYTTVPDCIHRSRDTRYAENFRLFDT